MLIIVGLGNMGQEYDGTRHNIGFEVVDLMAKSLSISFKAGGGPFLVAEGKYKGRKLILVKLTNYMNRSGTGVKKVLNKYQMEQQNCLVIYDDLNLPLGVTRMKETGSDGGHNGIADINDKIGREYPRLRVGIGNNFSKGRQVEYVLSTFENDEIVEVKSAIEKAHDAALAFVTMGIERAMNYFN